ncbi:MAG: RnfABCDGE type electron transport complex subunit D [Finegoldia sp.]|nr:RnfABCDGE type electron transport complex subunit D [Finegoldia sp.]
MKKFYNEYFMKQKMMHPVIFFLAILALLGTYNFGLKVLCLLAVNLAVALLVEYISNKKLYGRAKISEAVIVTAMLYTLTLPVSLPYWMSIVGIAFAVFFGKMIFGGFGRNPFNPALVGRIFVYINFPQPMTIYWNQAASGFPGGFGRYITEQMDSVTNSTPLLALKLGKEVPSYTSMVLGNYPGVIGESFTIVILIAAIYLIYKNIASWRIMLGCLAGFTGLSLIFNVLGVSSVPNPIDGLLAGGFLFGTVFMATDPVSASKTDIGKIIYGIIIGVVTVIIRGFALFAGGTMFAVLMGNTFAPIIDHIINALKAKKKASQSKELSKEAI